MTTASKIEPQSGSLADQSPIKPPSRWPSSMLRYSAMTWLLAAAVGQWIFVLYVTMHYVPELSINGLPGLANTSMPAGYVPGDLLGNISIAFHVIVAIVIIGSGPLQLTPYIRNTYPRFHRYVGRTYIVLAAVTSVAGLYMVWTRGVPGGMLGHIGISLDAVLIILFGGLAMYFAMKRQFDRHRRWAMRLFMVVSAVWFFRIGLMFWFVTTGGIGIDPETFEGPFLSFMYFGQMAIPLLVLECYFYAQSSRNVAVKAGVSVLLFVATAAMALGIFTATLGMWLPRL